MGKILTASEIMDTAQALYDWLDGDSYPECRMACGRILQNNGDPESALEYADLLSAADGRQELPARVGRFIIALYKTAIDLRESSAAMLNLGAFYYAGRCGEPDYDKAVKYYRMAAERGEIIALENLGYCCYHGRGVEVDYAEAYLCFSQAAMLGFPAALYKIGDMYRYGNYLPQRDEAAFAFYQRSLACLDDQNAGMAAGPLLLRLGDCYLSGIGIVPDAAQALECYQTAERYLFGMIAAGENLYRGSLQKAIDGQEAARQVLREILG